MEKIITYSAKGFLVIALFFVSLTGTAQNLISGKVLSKKDQSPVSSVTVAVKDNKTATATNIEGLFSITAKEGDILVFSGVGIKTEEVAVGNTKLMTVELELDAKMMNEVVVTAFRK
jgi:CarboxypepD_reg-like domain